MEEIQSGKVSKQGTVDRVIQAGKGKDRNSIQAEEGSRLGRGPGRERAKQGVQAEFMYGPIRLIGQ